MVSAETVVTELPVAPVPVIDSFSDDESHFPLYIEQLKTKALAQGINQQTIDEAFANVYFLKRAIQSDQNQLEKKITLDDYLKRVLPNKKVQRANQMYQANLKRLNQASERFGVPASYIVALWGMESNFGRMQGKEDIISAMATLAFEGRREAFFTKQLMAALQILQDKHITVDRMKGSWAGAMGQCQFMPTSFLTYAVDGDGDGKIDIWDNLDDVFASIANYLATEGWNSKESWGQEVRLREAFDITLLGLDDSQSKTISEWQKLGVVPSTKASPNQRAWLIQPDDSLGRTFMVSNNFRTIMHWNRSTYFAISIGTLADRIM